MICPSCKKDVEWKDFYGKSECYKCIYQEKLKRVKNVKNVCPICRDDIPKGRWRYCSKKCLEIGAFTQRANYQQKIRGICVNNCNWRDKDFTLSRNKEEDFDLNYLYV